MRFICFWEVILLIKNKILLIAIKKLLLLQLLSGL